MRKLTQEEFLIRVGSKNSYFKDGICNVVGEYINRRTTVLCRCNIHNLTWDEFPENLYRGYRCPKCDDRKCNDKLCDDIATKTFGNRLDLWTTHPRVAQLLKNPQDGYRYTHGSAKRLEFVCPDCGASKLLALNSVVNYGFSCVKCSDGVSLPNKYSRALLDQLLNCDYLCEYTPDWAKPYIYDNYFEYGGCKYILEMDGAYHYFERSVSKKTLSERQKDDAIKDQLATLNNVDIIRINCSVSQPDFIKEQILQSRLSDIFDLSKVNWHLCEEKSQRSLVKQVCEMYMSGLYAPSTIMHNLHICRDTLIKYLKIGAKLDWCDYDPEQTKTHAKAIVILDDDDNIVHSFYGLRECARQIKDIYKIDVYKQHIVQACKTHKTYKGFNFRFLNDLQNTMINIKEAV